MLLRRSKVVSQLGGYLVIAAIVYLPQVYRHLRLAYPNVYSLPVLLTPYSKMLLAFDHASQGLLVDVRLDDFVKNNPGKLDDQDPDTGLTLLALAVTGGFAEEVRQLLEQGAKVSALSRNGATPLLLANWQTKRERALIVHLLLSTTPSPSVDDTCAAADNKTPLMYAIRNEDIESIKMLCHSGASLTIKNNDGFNAEEQAEKSTEPAVRRAIRPENGTANLANLETRVIFARPQDKGGSVGNVDALPKTSAQVRPVLERYFKGKHDFIQELDNKFANLKNVHKALGDEDLPTKTKITSHDKAMHHNEQVDVFLKNLVGTDPVYRRFFVNKDYFIQELARRAAVLKNDPSTSHGDEDVLLKTTEVSLHQQVLYCDDSSSMKREGRWDAQKELVKRIAKVTTRILPEGEGVALRFINQDVNPSPNLSLSDLEGIIEPLSWTPNGDTAIGTYLRSKILEPLVFEKIRVKSLERPLLISIITDGMPRKENKSALVDAILECGNALEAAEYPRDSVKFMVGQIGTANQATQFLESLRSNKEIAPVAFVTSERLDAKFADLHGNSQNLDRWLIETLFKPIKAQ
ncbi:hypothetical protein ONZ45_g2825 [Pleurotus djamor]|nr:hypothetical protein ONZ45_g2825 [Pleurotus djamor]